MLTPQLARAGSEQNFDRDYTAIASANQTTFSFDSSENMVDKSVCLAYNLLCG
jgi:hypothetical protein